MWEVMGLAAVTVALDEKTFRFYRKVADNASLPVEQVLSDALFKLAGELSLEALAKGQKPL